MFVLESETKAAASAIDYGKAPIARTGGLARVEHFGSHVLLAFFAMQAMIVDGQLVEVPEVVQTVMIPVVALGPAIEEIISAMGPQQIWPSDSEFAHKLML